MRIAGETLVELARTIVQVARSLPDQDGPWVSAARCIAWPGGARCVGRLRVQLFDERIEWSCASCEARGVVTGFFLSNLDLSDFAPILEDAVRWGMDEEEYAVLWEATATIPSLRALIARTSPHPDDPSFVWLSAEVREFDELYTLVERLTEMTRRRHRRELLDGLRASLSASMDGF